MVDIFSLKLWEVLTEGSLNANISCSNTKKCFKRITRKPHACLLRDVSLYKINKHDKGKGNIKLLHSFTLRIFVKYGAKIILINAAAAGWLFFFSISNHNLFVLQLMRWRYQTYQIDRIGNFSDFICIKLVWWKILVARQTKY